MAIPDFQTLMLPILEAVVDRREHRGSTLIAAMVDRFGLTDAERQELLPSGRQPTIANRVHWSITYLAKCALLERPRRGFARITQRGLDVLAERPARIDLKYLARFSELEQFRGPRSKGDGEKSADFVDTAPIDTPDERLRRAYDEIEAALRDELLARLRAQSPAFFETVVVDLLVAMG